MAKVVARRWEGKASEGKRQEGMGSCARKRVRVRLPRGIKTSEAEAPLPLPWAPPSAATERSQSAREDRWRRRHRIPRKDQGLEGRKLRSVAGLKHIRHASRARRAVTSPVPGVQNDLGPHGSRHRSGRSAESVETLRADAGGTSQPPPVAVGVRAYRDGGPRDATYAEEPETLRRVAATTPRSRSACAARPRDPVQAGAAKRPKRRGMAWSKP
jgi:hypothetical protein